MGKVTCAVCNKSCKGQAIRLEQRYFHIKCFKCRECGKSLATGGFYTKDDAHYCANDYQRLYGTRCHFCGEYVEAEAVTVLNHTFHENCFRCTSCRQFFKPGDKVTFSGETSKCYLCAECADDEPISHLTASPQSLSPTTAPREPGGRRIGGGPSGDGAVEQRKGGAITNGEGSMSAAARACVSAPVTPARQQPLHNENNVDLSMDGNLSSPTLNCSMDDDSCGHGDSHKTTRTNGGLLVHRNQQDMARLTSPQSGFKSDASHDRNIMSRSSDAFDSSFGDDTRESRRRLSPIQNIMRYRSASPGGMSQTSKKSKDSIGSSGSRLDMDFGKFYQSSYLDKIDSRGGGSIGFKRGPSINPTQKMTQHYHRPPENFSYTKTRKDIQTTGRSTNKPSVGIKGLGMLVGIGNGSRQQMSALALHKLEPYRPIKTQEPIQLSKMPNAKTDDSLHVAPIDRDDWPAPPAPAAAYPELLRGRSSEAGYSRSGRSSRAASANAMDDEDKENGRLSSAKIDRDIDELSKIPDSGAAKVILGDLVRLKTDGVTLDPRSSSRTPNAANEPPFKPRYDSPLFASPSRDLDLRERAQSSLEGLIIERKYRTTPIPMGNSGSVSDSEGPAKNVVRSNREAPRPGYSIRSPRPASTIGNGRQLGFSYDDVLGSSSPWRPRSAVDITAGRLSIYSSQSRLADDELDPLTGLRHRSRTATLSTATDGLGSSTYLGYRKSVPNLFRGASDEPPKVYPYERLKNEEGKTLPRGVEKGSIEQHLSKEDFERVFGMTAEEFYRLAEWKRNDLKMRHGLY